MERRKGPWAFALEAATMATVANRSVRRLKTRIVLGAGLLGKAKRLWSVCDGEEGEGGGGGHEVSAGRQTRFCVAVPDRAGCWVHYDTACLGLCLTACGAWMACASSIGKSMCRCSILLAEGRGWGKAK
jgi:hypothetical protein